MNPQDFVTKVITQDYDAVRKAIATGFDVNSSLPWGLPVVQTAEPAKDPVMLRILWEAGAKPTSAFLEEVFADFAKGGDGSVVLKPKLVEVGRLILRRFCGNEEFAVVGATMVVSREGKKSRLCFKIQTEGVCLKSLPDTAELRARPNAEVSVFATAKEFAANKLAGKSYSVPRGYDEKIQDHVAIVYYTDHQDLEEIEIKVLSKEGNTFRVQWTGTTMDVNNYDGSKPKTRVEIEANFTLQ